MLVMGQPSDSVELPAISCLCSRWFSARNIPARRCGNCGGRFNFPALKGRD